MKKELSFSDVTESLFEKIDISPTQYKTAIEHYQAVAQCLADGDCGDDIYVQGSFALGTVIRPFRKGQDSDFDLDIVCQGQERKDEILPNQLKLRTGECILASSHHSGLLDKEEGRRCWTLNYAPDDSGVGFHMDILPCVLEDAGNIALIKQKSVAPEYAEHAIAITDKNKQTGAYGWSTGNARGYAQWFADINVPYLAPVSAMQKARLVELRAFETIEDVPLPVLRSPLQRVVQLLKRHRDCRFDAEPNADDKPISIIITTLVAQIAQRLALHNADVKTLLMEIVDELLQFSPLLESNFEYRASLLPREYFTRTRQDGWIIPNPVNSLENFAERWSENNNAKAKAFFQWLEWVKVDFYFDGKDSGQMFKALQESFGADSVTSIYSALQLNPLPEAKKIAATSTKTAPKPYMR